MGRKLVDCVVVWEGRIICVWHDVFVELQGGLRRRLATLDHILRRTS